MSDVAIRVDGIGKRYQLGERLQYKMLRDSIASSVSAPLARLRRALIRSQTPIHESEDVDHFWALKDLSFEIDRGEVVAIVGANGSGKSTLLKILCRIIKPTEGQSEVFGRLGALLEVGTGFHPELTGRENIQFNGVILGLSKSEIAKRFDEIVEFAGVGAFIDTPIKHYSTGMMIRLAFSVASQLDSEILLVDEVLSVGDADFQKRSVAKIHDATRDGRTVLIVSHDLAALRQLCTRGILLESGRLTMDGPMDAVCQRYAPDSPVASVTQLAGSTVAE